MQGDAHILVVDDDARIRRLLVQFLARNGYWVTAARDAAHARRLMASLVFDLVILDVMMPGEDGLSLTRSLRRDHAVPVILLTARGGTDDRIAGLETGADDYLAKPSTRASFCCASAPSCAVPRRRRPRRRGC